MQCNKKYRKFTIGGGGVGGGGLFEFCGFFPI